MNKLSLINYADNLFNIVYFEHSEHAKRAAQAKLLGGIKLCQVWLTWIFSIVIILGIIAWIGLSIYQKIRQIQGKKKDKKEIKSKEDKE